MKMEPSAEEFDGEDRKSLFPADYSVCAVCALLETPEEKYILQLRDNTEGIWFPDTWGLFGGLIGKTESPQEALCRELKEELELDINPKAPVYFTQFAVDARGIDMGLTLRLIYRIPVTRDQIEAMVLHEGAAFRDFTPAELVSGKYPLVPTDLMALHMYFMGQGIVPSPDPEFPDYQS